MTKEKKKEKTLQELKKEYEKIEKKYSLPPFKELNKDFQIEKIAEYETDCLLREVRKFMADKFLNYLRFVESVLHPVNAPIFIFSIIKSIGSEEKRKFEEIYKKLAGIEIKLIEVDIDSSEEKEAEFIKKSYDMWQGIKKEILEIIESIKKAGKEFGINIKSYLW